MWEQSGNGGAGFYTFRTFETILSREFSLVGIHVLFVQGVVSFPPQKKIIINLELYLFPVHEADRRRVCSGGGVWGEG